jgi:atypical dual specificity phosphatase
MSEWFRRYGFADIDEGLVIGACPLDARDVTVLSLLHIERVLNLVEEYPPGAHELVARALAQANIVERRLPTIDHGHLPAPLLDAAVETIGGWLDEGFQVYVHCRAGWERSPTVAAALLATRQQLDLDEALARVQERKPSAAPLPHQLEDLQRCWTAQQRRGRITS